MDLLLIIFLVIVSLVLFLVAILIEIFWGVYPFLFWGAIYVPTTDENVEQMISFLEIKPGQKIADLGAGNGKLVIAASKMGAEAHGYEINPFLVYRGRKKIRELGLQGKAFMHYKNLWHQDCRSFDAVAIYAMKHMMKGLEKKFERELKPGARIASNYFVFPNWKPEKSEKRVHLYFKKLDK